MREAQDSGQQRLEGFRKARGNILARLYICIWMRPQSLYRRCWCSRSSDPERGGNGTLRALLGRDRRLDFSIFRVKSSVIGRRRLGCFTLSRSLEMPLGDRNCVYIELAAIEGTNVEERPGSLNVTNGMSSVSCVSCWTYMSVFSTWTSPSIGVENIRQLSTVTFTR